MTVWQLMTSHFRLLALGVLLTALSGFGQTFLISVFGGELRAALGLGNTGYGLVYSLATVASAATLVRVGRVVDTRDLKLVTAAVLAAAALGCVLLAGVQSVAMLLLAFYILRLSGQGMMVHVAQTTMARYFQAERGRAVSIATLGLPMAEAVLPLTMVAMMAWVGWRGAWLTAGTALLVVMIPLSLFLLRGHAARADAWQAEQDARAEATEDNGRQWRRRDVLRHPTFYALLPTLLGPPLIVTALFFHQVPLAADKGWSVEWLAASFPAFGATHVIGLLGAGPLVDRLGAQRLVPFLLVPMVLALLVLTLTETAWAAPVYLLFMGLSAGTTGTLMGAIWAELYGTAHLGAIRALAQSIMIVATAVTPVVIGWVLDSGGTAPGIALAFAGYCVAAMALAGTAGQRR